MSGDLHIDELVLRIPGLDPDEARIVGEAVARQVGERLAAGATARADLGALDLRLHLPPGSRQQLVDALAEAILARLG